MSRDRLILSPAGKTESDGWLQLRWRVAGRAAGPFDLVHAVPAADGAVLAAPERGDAALAAVLLLAMQEQRDVEVEGEVSPTLLAGLETTQHIWHRWRAARYRPVTLRAAVEREPASAAVEGRPAICAFSGGLDASFTLYRHRQGQPGRLTRPIEAALLVHGMDIPLARTAEFDNAAAKAQQMLAGTGVPLLRMRSNARELGQDWADACGLLLNACFLNLQDRYRWALRGSDAPYEAMVLPWGTSPWTDPLCSTAAMRMEHDGCEFDRCDKAAWLATHADIGANLRVCWAGPLKDRNCGQCEKCVRTMLNFWAVGQAVPQAFPTGLTPQRVRSLQPRNDAQLEHIRVLHRHAVRHHAARDPLLRAVEAVLRRAAWTRWAGQTVRLARRALAPGPVAMAA